MSHSGTDDNYEGIAFNWRLNEIVNNEEDPFRKGGLRRSPLTGVATNTSEHKKAHSEISRASDLDTTANLPPSLDIRTSLQTLSQIGEEMQDYENRSSPKLTDHRFEISSLNSPQNIEKTQKKSVEQRVSSSSTTFLKQAQSRVIFPTEIPNDMIQVEVANSPEFPNLNVKISTQLLLEENEPGLHELEPRMPNLGSHSTPGNSSPSFDVASEKQKFSCSGSNHSAPTAQEFHVDGLREDKNFSSERNAQLSIPNLHASKKNLRDSLVRELEQLRADVALAKAENKRLRSPDTDLSSNPKLSEEVYSMLLRAIGENKKPENKKVESSIFKNLSAFLPFSSRRRRLAPAREQTAVLEEKVPSISPWKTENSLPYLQAFTPLTWSSKIALLQPCTSSASSDDLEGIDNQEILQQIITASHPQGFFSARLAFTVDATNRTVRSLSLLKLPMCAEQELGTFIRNTKRGSQVPDRGNTDREIGVVCYAIGRWVEVSLHRAEFWSRIDQRYATPEARKLSFKSKHHSRKKRKQIRDTDEEGREDLDTNTGTLKQLLPHLGRTIFCIDCSTTSTSINRKSNDLYGIELLFEWNLTFDWTGEVTSHLTARVRAPKTWHESDAHKSFHRIPDLFRRLVREKGPLTAVAAIVSLTLGDSS